MLFFVIVWALFGVAVWVNAYLELLDHPVIRPGIFDLVFLMVCGPIPLIIEFKK